MRLRRDDWPEQKDLEGNRIRNAGELGCALMDIDLASLPDEVETLQRMVRSLAVVECTNLSEAQAEIERLRLIIKKLQPVRRTDNPAHSRIVGIHPT